MTGYDKVEYHDKISPLRSVPDFGVRRGFGERDVFVRRSSASPQPCSLSSPAKRSCPIEFRG